ncbi:MAG: sensor histidine kinase [Actinophytocola sp.]|uniref:sensor histidine kinase n=1 Tax=Actinophytocola sp. TaxID=1872138 RepID=UPI003D6A9293
MPIPNLVASLRRRRREVGVVALDVAVAAGVTLLNLEVAHLVRWAPLTLGVVCVALLVRRRWPEVTTAVAVGGVLLDVPLYAMVVALYTIASRRGPGVRTWLALVAAFLAAGGAALGGVDWQYVLLGVGTFTIVPVLAGLWMWQRQRLLAALRERAEQAERERHLLAEREVAAERRRIAGEMHDVVAHRVSVVAVQAGALEAISHDDDRVVRIAEVIRDSSTAALAELRDVLRVLRRDESGTGPAPTLDGLTQLVDDFRRVGATVDVRLPDPLPETNEQVARAVYRLVQEALTNAGKHASGAPARVAITDDGTDLAVAVTNDRPNGQRQGELPTSGFGLVGMRERVSLAGGSVTTGPTAEGGYAVRASFPKALE